MTGRRRAAAVLLIAYGALVVAEVVGLLTATPLEVVADLTLMPVLVAFLLVGAGARARLVRWTVAGLVLSYAGDNAGDMFVKIALFLPAVLAYAAGFWPYRRDSFLLRRLPLVAFVLVLLGLVVLTATHAGPLAVPVAAYGSCLGLMVVTSSGVDRLTAVGGLLFLLSDVVLGLDVFVLRGGLPAGDLLNQVLYLPAQALIVVGVRRRVGRDRRT